MLNRNLSILPFLCLTLCWLGFACQGGANAQSSAAQGIYEDIDAATFAAKMQSETDYVLLDVRTPKEVANGKIDGAMELNYHSPDFATKLAALDKDKTYLVYCAVGGRSGKTCKMMQEQGFRECYNLLGGYKGWGK